MPSSYTSLLGLVLPVQGELQGTWGDTVNNELTSLLDTAIAGTTTLSSDADVTLTDTDGTANQSRQQIILWTATGTVTRNITAPAQSKTYVVINATGGTQSIVIRGAGPTTGVTVAAGEKAVVAWNGSDFALVAIPFVAPGPSGNVLTSNGTTWTSASVPAGGLTYLYKTANYTASDKEGILADTSGGAFTVTLPATPATGAQVVVADAGGTWGTNNLTVGRNGSTISSAAQDLVCDISGVSVQLVYDGTTWEVYAQVGGNGGTAVTLDGVQTLTNKTIAYASNTLTGVAPTSQPTLTGLKETKVAVAASDIDLSAGNYFTKTISGTTTFTVSNVATSGSVSAFVLDLTNGGSATVNWFSGVTWNAATAPTLTASGRDVLAFFTYDGGTTWNGFVLGQGMA